MSLKKLYWKKYKEILGFIVWLVDGKYIREHLDIEFTNCAQHYQFHFIPKNEFWIDRFRIAGEEKYYINSMLLMNKLLARGIKHKEAVKIADKQERQERLKSKFAKRYSVLRGNKKKLINFIHKKFLREFSNSKVKVWFVKGRCVRDLYFPDFTHGGNDKVYKFVPKYEVWIDDSLNPKERKFAAVHELYERNLIAYKSLKYEKAHKLASKLELSYRKNQKGLMKRIREEAHKAKENC